MQTPKHEYLCVGSLHPSSKCVSVYLGMYVSLLKLTTRVSLSGGFIHKHQFLAILEAEVQDQGRFSSW